MQESMKKKIEFAGIFLRIHLVSNKDMTIGVSVKILVS
jgi:hypothetical protein